MSNTAIFSFNMPYKMDFGKGGSGRCRNCDTNLTTDTPANQYQRLKIIQKTVRVPSSLYTMNIGALSAYKQPTAKTHGVCWNQQSDRPFPSVARETVPSGHSSLAVSHKGGGFGWGGRSYTQTSSRPGAQMPGGVGCDIKHNCYMRHLNRIKAMGPLKQQGVPISFGGFIPFNRAVPIYGGKTMKTGISANCNCNDKYSGNIQLLYQGSDMYGELYPNITLSLSVGDKVYALYPGVSQCYSVATINTVNGDGFFIIQFEDGTTDTQNLSQLRIYYPCGESQTAANDLLVQDFIDINGETDTFNSACIYPNNSFIQTLFA